MRTFILSLVVLALIVGTLFFTGLFLQSRTSKLSDFAKKLPIITTDMPMPSPEDFNSAAEDFSRLWNKTRKIIHFLVGHEEADKIDEAFTDLRVRFVTHDPAGCMSAREKLLQTITRLADSESFSFDTIT